MTDDIISIEKSEESKVEIKNLCTICENFIPSEDTTQTIKNANGEEEIIAVKIFKDMCQTTNKHIVFSNLKQSDVCPIGKW